MAETHVVSQLAADSRLAQSCLQGLPGDQAERALAVLARACEHQDRARRLIATALRDDLAGLALPAARVARQNPGDLGDLLADALDDAPAAGEVPNRYWACRRGNRKPRAPDLLGQTDTRPQPAQLTGRRGGNHDHLHWPRTRHQLRHTGRRTPAPPAHRPPRPPYLPMRPPRPTREPPTAKPRPPLPAAHTTSPPSGAHPPPVRPDPATPARPADRRTSEQDTTSTRRTPAASPPPRPPNPPSPDGRMSGIAVPTRASRPGNRPDDDARAPRLTAALPAPARPAQRPAPQARLPSPPTEPPSPQSRPARKTRRPGTWRRSRPTANWPTPTLASTAPTWRGH